MQQCQRRRQRGAGYAISDGMHVLHVQPLADVVDGVHLGAHVIVPDHVLHAGIGRFPADHEHRDALFHRPAHEALLGVEVQDIETVDPRREDHQRHVQHRFGCRGILDQLVHRRFVNDLAGRHGDILAQLEGAGIGMGQLPPAQIGQQMLHAFHQILAARLQRALHHYRVQQRKVRRACRFGDRAGGEAQLFALVVRQALHLVDHVGHAFGQEQIGLVDQRIGGVGTPARIGKAPVRARQVGLALRFGLPIRTKAVLSQHLLPHRHAFLHQRLLLRRVGDRHLAVPVLRQLHPAGRVHIGGQRLRIGQLLGLVFQPHPLQLRADGGPLAHVFRAQRRSGTRFREGRKHRAREFRGCFEHVGEGIGAVVGHSRSSGVSSACLGSNRILRVCLHLRRLHLHGE